MYRYNSCLFAFVSILWGFSFRLCPFSWGARLPSPPFGSCGLKSTVILIGGKGFVYICMCIMVFSFDTLVQLTTSRLAAVVRACTQCTEYQQTTNNIFLTYFGLFPVMLNKTEKQLSTHHLFLAFFRGEWLTGRLWVRTHTHEHSKARMTSIDYWLETRAVTFSLRLMPKTT